MKKHFTILIFLLVNLFSVAQKPTLGIIELKSNGIDLSNEQLTDIIRFEIEKTQKFNLLEKEEMNLRLAKKQHDPQNCFNQLCLIFTGKTLLVDKMLSGSVNKLGDNKLVVLKLYDIESESLQASKKIEVIADEDLSINTIISKSVNEFFKNKEPITTLDLTEKKITLDDKSEKEENTEKTSMSNNYPPPVRYYNGVAVDVEDSKSNTTPFPKFTIIARPSTLIEPFSKLNMGYIVGFDDMLALKNTFSYIFTSEDDNEESILTNSEPGASYGYEGRVEFMMKMPKSFATFTAYGKEYISFEAVYQRKRYKPIDTYKYDYNIGTLLYEVDGQRSVVVMGNVKYGVHNVFSDKIYLDMYMGLGLRNHRYTNETTIQAAGHNVESRIYPNMVAGFDLGFIIKK